MLPNNDIPDLSASETNDPSQSGSFSLKWLVLLRLKPTPLSLLERRGPAEVFDRTGEGDGSEQVMAS